MHSKCIILATASLLFLFASAATGQWVKTDCPLSAHVRSIAVDGTRIIAGTDNGVFLSVNDGATWTAIDSGLLDTTIEAIATSGANIFAASYDKSLSLSTNNGTSWNKVFQASAIIHTIAIIGANVFAGSGDGAWLSTDGGVDWIKAGTDFPAGTSIHSFAVMGTSLFAGATNGLWLSTNSGSSWKAVNTPWNKNYSVYPLAVIGTNLFAGVANQVYLSSDSGTNWHAINAGRPGGTIEALAASGANLFAAVGGSGICLTTNSGTDWSTDNTGLSNLTVECLGVNGTHLFTGIAGSGVWKRPLSQMITSVENSQREFPSNTALTFTANPNPANDQLEIRYNATSPNLEVRLYNILGELVMSLHGNSIGKRLLNVGELRSGLYYLSLQDGMASATRQVMIIH